MDKSELDKLLAEPLKPSIDDFAAHLRPMMDALAAKLKEAKVLVRAGVPDSEIAATLRIHPNWLRVARKKRYLP